MVIIDAILLAYVIVTAPVVAYIGYRTWVRMHSPADPKAGKSVASEVLNAIDASSKTAVAWLTHITNSQETLKHDSQAMLQSTKALALVVLDIQSTVKAALPPLAPTKDKALNEYIHALEYARDKFASTKTQKGTVESIINIIKHKHGSESK